MNRFLIIAVVIAGSPLGGAGCSRPTPPPPNTQPTAFFDWCYANHFGVKSPQRTGLRNATKNVASGQIGLTEQMAWTPCKTEPEARKFLEDTIAELRRVATEHGLTVEAGDDAPNPQGYRVLLRYRSGPNVGTLEGKFSLNDTEEDGKTVKAYFVYHKLTETIVEAK
jgi:hypothetical protein